MAGYSLSIAGVLVLCLVSIALAVYSGSSKGRRGRSPDLFSGGDNNLLYRIDRVHMNAVEALTPFVVPAVLAMMVRVSPATLATLVWVYVVIRVIHIAVYLRDGNAAKGGSVRTILYVSGALVTMVSLPRPWWRPSTDGAISTFAPL